MDEPGPDHIGPARTRTEKWTERFKSFGTAFTTK